MSYTVYHLHSDDSLLDSCSNFKEYLDLAEQQGMKSIAFSEHGKPLGWVSKKIECDKRGIKYIHAVEIYLTEQLEPRVRDNFHTVLIAKNLAGVRELNELIALSSDEHHFYYTNRISFEEFLSLSDNIITTSACLASPLAKLPRDHHMFNRLVERYDYLEVQPHICDDQREYNSFLLQLALEFNKQLIAGTDTHNSSRYKAECRSILMKYKDKSYGNEDDFDLTWHTREELEEMFRLQGALPKEVYLDAIDATNRMADSVEEFELDRRIKYPILYGTHENDSQKFEALIEEKLTEKLNTGVIPRHQESAFRDAIAEELRVFRKLHMDGFMLSMAELLGWCRENNIPVGPARGSVGGSRIAYVTDVIDLNPETWHTVFSRFCNEDREEIGDIDVDVIDTDRPAIFKHIIGRFGKKYTARVGAYGTLADLATIDAIGGALRKRWEEKNHPDKLAKFLENSKRLNWQSITIDPDNPYHLKRIDKMKKEYSSDPDAARKAHPEVFYYYDGLHGTKSSQSVHPAGIVISPVDLQQEFGCFYKDDDLCLVMDMDEAHEVGLAKYDFLILKTVTVIRDTCRLIGIPYPRSHEIDWEDKAVWQDMLKSPGGIFQFEGGYAFESPKKFRPQSIFDMSLVTACIRPSGASYRDQLLARMQHHNPSEIIDDLLKENLGYLIYQEDTIKFLQQICGLSGSEADNIRRAIGRKQKDRLDKAMPSILEGYCRKSPRPRNEAEEEAKEFLQIIEDSASYQFGYNHSIAYCLLGYLCAYYRYYYPAEFITAFLNNAANDEDIHNGTTTARQYGISVTSPRFGISGGEYACSPEDKTIAKGISSIKFMSTKASKILHSLGSEKEYTHFMDVLMDLTAVGGVDHRQIDILLHIDFFRKFGNQRELERIVGVFDFFKCGEAKQIKKEKVAGSYAEPIVQKYSTSVTKSGKESASYTILDIRSILRECEERILGLNLPDLDVISKIRYFNEAMGYSGYVTGRDEDRPLLYVKEIYPLHRKKDGKQFGWSIITQSIGSGIETRFTVFNRVYDKEPIDKGDVITCTGYTREGQYFTMTGYRKHYPGEQEVFEEESE